MKQKKMKHKLTYDPLKDKLTCWYFGLILMIIQAELKPKPIKYKIEMLDITYIKKKLKKK